MYIDTYKYYGNVLELFFFLERKIDYKLMC